MDLLAVKPGERSKLLDEVDSEHREHYFATSKCPINADVDDMMEEV